MEELINLLCNLGYTKEESKGILNTYPLNTCKPETLKKKIEKINIYMEKLGYSRAEVIKMTKSQPAIYGYSTDNIKQKIEDMEKLGYSKEEVIKITKSLPPIYSYSTDTLKQKIEEYIQQKKTQDLGKETLEIQKETSYIQQTEHAMNNQEQMLEQKNQDGINID